LLDTLLPLLQRLGVGGLVLLRRLQRRQALGVQLLVRRELRVATEHDVGTATGHVRRDGDGALAARLGDDRRLLRVVFRVQYLVLDAAHLQRPRQILRLLHARGADEYRLALLVTLGDVV